MSSPIDKRTPRLLQGNHVLRTYEDFEFLVACLKHWPRKARWFYGTQYPHDKLSRKEFDRRRKDSTALPQWFNDPSVDPISFSSTPSISLQGPYLSLHESFVYPPHATQEYYSCNCGSVPYPHIHVHDGALVIEPAGWYQYHSQDTMNQHLTLPPPVHGQWVGSSGI